MTAVKTKALTRKQLIQLILDITGVTSSVALILILLIFGFVNVSMILVGTLLMIAVVALFGSLILRLLELFTKH